MQLTLARSTLGLVLVLVAGAALPRAHADEEKEKQAVAAKERVKRIAAELEEIRGAKFEKEVGVEVQSAEDFKKFVEGEIDKELPPDLAARQARAYVALGVVPEGYDLRKGLVDLFVSQAGAYYNPATKTFYILMAGLPDDQMDAVILHELQHALQDQRHDLAGLQKAVSKETSDDRKAAFGFMVEGEATYVQLRFQLGQQLGGRGMKLDSVPPASLEMAFKMTRDIDRKALLGQAEMMAKTGASPEIAKAMLALKDVPPFLFWGLHDPYLKGQFAVFKVHATKGWEGVDALFKKLPESTEQILHPEKLLEKPDEPTVVTEAEMPDHTKFGMVWTLVYTNELGEAGVLAFLDAHGVKDRTKIAAGWDGDRYSFYEGPDGTALVWKSVWDSEADALEFKEAILKVEKGAFASGPGAMKKVVNVDGTRASVFAGNAKTVDALLAR